MKKIGLSLSSGGARGFAHVGVIKVLQKHNIPIHCVAGTSMGAAVAAYFALFGEVARIEEIGRTFSKKDTLKLIDVNNPKYSLVKGEKARAFLNGIYQNKSFKDTKIQLRIGATALEDGKQYVFSKGKVVDAVMASGALPGVFPPIKHAGLTLVDGGIADYSPVGLLKEMGAEVIISVELSYLKKTRLPDVKITTVLERTYNILTSYLIKESERENMNNLIVLRPETGSRNQTFFFHRAKQFIREGEIEAEKYIKKIKEMIR